jgi:glycerate-2-kinase
MIIKNRDALLSHGNVPGRTIVLDILEAGLAAPDPYENTLKNVRVENDKLIVGNPEFSEPPGRQPVVFDLSQVRNIYLVGGGKAAQRMAEAVEHVLGDRITEGHVNAKKGDTIRLKHATVTLAGHPLPDEDSVAGAARIVEVERKAQKGDIVFACLSGGATALCALPVPGVSLQDLRRVYELLYFGAGANMPVANAVRNQLAMLNGRWQRYAGDATFIQLLTEENPPKLRIHLFDRKNANRADPYDRAINVLKEHDCWDKAPDSVRAFLLKRDPRYGPITPAETAGKPHYYFRIMGPEYMLEAARARAEALGLGAHIIASSVSDLEAQPIAEAFAYMAQEVEVLGRPFQPPCVLICGGELVVTVGDATGVGGRSQEFVLTAAQRVDGSKNIVIASADSDGVDGPTDSAGGIVDGSTMSRAREMGIDVAEELHHHNSNPALKKLGDTISTGIRMTNVRDLRVVYIGGRSG